MTPTERLGQISQVARKHRGESLRDAAPSMGVDYTRLHRIEQGSAKSVTLDQAVLLMEHYELDPAILFTDAPIALSWSETVG